MSMTSGALRMVTIFRFPVDYPGKYVVREFWIAPSGQLTAACEPLAVVDTLREARAIVPPGLVCLTRSAGDDVIVVESWL